MKKLLLLEDDPSFGYILSEYLQMQDFEVHWVKTGEEALLSIERSTFDLAILDIMLPTINGFEVAQLLKQKNKDLPFIFLSAKSLKIDKLKGFKMGAFDYVTKPIEEEVLVAKIQALLNQVYRQEKVINHFILGAYHFYPTQFKLVFNEEEIKLTARENDLLVLLCNHQNVLLSREKALRQIWGDQDEFSRKSMDVFISHLRKYLAKDPQLKIENVHGKGFIFKT